METTNASARSGGEIEVITNSATTREEDCPEPGLDAEDSFWIGMHDMNKNGNHKWASGRPLHIPYQWYNGRPAKIGEFRC